MKKATVTSVITTAGAIELEHYRITGKSAAVHEELAERDFYLDVENPTKCDEALVTMLQYEDGIVDVTITLLLKGEAVSKHHERHGI